MTNACPTCGSRAPHLHPAVQHEGEVHICQDSFHLRLTSQNGPQRPEPPDYKSMDGPRLLEVLGDDAHRWAEAFAQIFPNAGVDQGTMVTWFANAIEHSYDKRIRQLMLTPAVRMVLEPLR